MIASVMNANTWRRPMNKLLTVIAATFLAIAAIASGAEAGFNVRINAPAGFSEVHKAGCGGSHFRAFRRRAVRQSVRRTKRKVEVASRKPAVIAKAEPKPEPVEAAAEKLAEIENSSIVSAADKVAEAKIEAPEQKPEPKAAESKSDGVAQKVATAIKDVGCKTFFASVGMTLSVPCAK
jgi:hypothetical protein